MCEDGDLILVGEATESEGRLEVCFGKRWGTIDGHGWTHTDTQAACRQLGHPTEGIYMSLTNTLVSSIEPPALKFWLWIENCLLCPPSAAITEVHAIITTNTVYNSNNCHC